MKYHGEHKLKSRQTFGLLLLILFVFSIPNGAAMPPHPDVVTAAASETNGSPGKLGLNNSDPNLNAPSKLFGASKTQITGSFKALAVLINFTDKSSSVNPANFDTLSSQYFR